MTDVIEIFCSTGVMYKCMIYDLQNEYKQVVVLHLSKEHHVQFPVCITVRMGYLTPVQQSIMGKCVINTSLYYCDVFVLSDDQLKSFVSCST